MSNPNQHKAEYKTLVLFPLFGLAMAFAYKLFIFPNQFAPSGIGGIATMSQYILEKNYGIHSGAAYLNLLLNLPILAVAWKLVNREFVIKTFTFTLSFSAFLVVLDQIDFGRFIYHTDTGTSTVLAPIAAAAVNGAFYGFCLRCHGSSGGTDVVSFCIRHYRPEYNVAWLSFTINAIIACASYFVYDYQFEPVICCIIYCFVLSFVGNQVLRGSKSALKFEIITQHPQELSEELLTHLNRGVTLLPAEGGYTHQQKSLVICIVNKHQIADIQTIISKYPGSFAYITSVSETLGNFVKVK